VLPLGYPSRFHAKISDQDGGLVLEDLNSTNGTFVNDQRLSGPTIVKAGDVIKFSTEAYNLLDFGLHDKPIISGKLLSRSINNTDDKARPNINDTIVR
jgi:pSer/pThr/pTyr-binding forkhead associated (FHA) protein